jgi:hypothetical protein
MTLKIKVMSSSETSGSLRTTQRDIPESRMPLSHCSESLRSKGKLKNAVLWDVVPCESCKNGRFGGTCRLHLQGRKNTRMRKVLDISKGVNKRLTIGDINVPGTSISYTALVHVVARKNFNLVGWHFNSSDVAYIFRVENAKKVTDVKYVASTFIPSWRWNRHVPPKCPLNFNRIRRCMPEDRTSCFSVTNAANMFLFARMLLNSY